LKIKIFIVAFFLIQNNFIYSQTAVHDFGKLNLYHISPIEKTESTSSIVPIGIGLASFLYLFNPIVQFENDKISSGLTKEISLGFGNFGEYRASVEYTYLFRENQKSMLRAGLKYDILLKKGIKPSNTFQGTSVFTIGGGYFTDFDRSGIFPEFSYGYSIRNDKLLFYPNIKVRYTFVEQGSDITDISFGIVLGFANPFMNLNIRSKDFK